jgi:hypothetical protein
MKLSFKLWQAIDGGPLEDAGIIGQVDGLRRSDGNVAVVLVVFFEKV